VGAVVGGDELQRETLHASSADANFNGYDSLAINIGATTFADNAVTNGVPYYYAVSAVSANGESTLSWEAAATPGSTAPLPPAPVTQSAAVVNRAIAVTWSGAGGATSYNVLRATSSGGPYVTVRTGETKTNHADVAVTDRVTYYYVTTAENATGQSDLSNQVSATAVPAPLPATGLTALPGDGMVTLSWNPVPGAVSYKAKQALTSSGPYATDAVGITTARYVAKHLVNGTTYYFVVETVAADAQSAPSPAIAATPAKASP
jgi:cellulose 1,4-beta-cellobiosidase